MHKIFVKELPKSLTNYVKYNIMIKNLIRKFLKHFKQGTTKEVAKKYVFVSNETERSDFYGNVNFDNCSGTRVTDDFFSDAKVPGTGSPKMDSVYAYCHYARGILVFGN